MKIDSRFSEKKYTGSFFIFYFIFFAKKKIYSPLGEVGLVGYVFFFYHFFISKVTVMMSITSVDCKKTWINFNMLEMNAQIAHNYTKLQYDILLKFTCLVLPLYVTQGIAKKGNNW